MKTADISEKRLVVQELKELARRLRETGDPREAADLISLIADLSEKLSITKSTH